MHARPLAERLEELMQPCLVLTKHDAAKEQLECAIRLFFATASPVSQHTLIAAAHGILRDVAARRGIKKSFKDSSLISDAERPAYLKAVHLPQNFFKHADRDPTSRIEFRYELNSLLLLDALVLWACLDEELSYPMRVFLMWVQLEFPNLLCHPAAEKDLEVLRQQARSSSAFRALANELLSEAASQ